MINDLVMPLLGLLTGNIDFSNLFIALDGNHYDSLAAAEAAEAAVFKYGSFISNVINFIIVAFVIFLVVRQINKIRNKFAKPEPEAVPTTKICPYCRSEIDINATRCPHCTSEQTDSL